MLFLVINDYIYFTSVDKSDQAKRGIIKIPI